MLNAARLIKTCWNGRSSSTIIGCWLQSNCLPHTPNEIGAEVRDYRSQEGAINEICNLVSSIHFDEDKTEKLDKIGLKDLAEVVINEGKCSLLHLFLGGLTWKRILK